jgi:predicted RNA binding protein YcfA (HicA-like mRNA interferase family)
MTDGEAVRALRAAGWRVLRQRSSHMVLTRGLERLVVAVGRAGKHRTSPGQRAKIRKASKA